MKSEKKHNHLLFCVTFASFIAIIHGWKCQLYFWTGSEYTGNQWGPFDVGEWATNTGGSYRQIVSAKLYSSGYYCHTDFVEFYCNSKVIATLDASPFGISSIRMIYNSPMFNAGCGKVSAVDTPSPTISPSGATSLPTSASPTLIRQFDDYNNETSDDGNDEIRQFDDKHIMDIDNYFTNGTLMLEFNSSHDQHKQQLIECAEYDCVIQCNHSASCLETDIQISVQNKTTLLLCHDDYSCASASVKTQSGSMANISVVCIGKYSCINMDIQLANISSFNLYCLQYK
eukprot:483935_1